MAAKQKKYQEKREEKKVTPKASMRDDDPVEEGALASPTIEMYLVEIVYPIKKRDLIAGAERVDTPKDILGRLEMLPDQTYESPDDVLKELRT